MKQLSQSRGHALAGGADGGAVVGSGFSLTPALSRWERENRSQFSGKAMTGFCSTTFAFYKNVQRLFLLPAGEGQDEGERGRPSPVTKVRLKFLQLASIVLFFLISIPAARAQAMPLGHAKDFTSHTYFEPPNEQKIKMTLTGAEASPLPGGLLDVKRLRIETFSVAGQTELIVRAPQCAYAPLDGVASSPGHLEMQTGDGKLFVTGEGFLWRQNDSLLIISNRVHTVIDTPALNTSTP